MDEGRSQEAPGTQGQASLDQAGFDLGAPPVSAPPATGAYRVLARKYRPSTFEDLIGQEAMVRTLRNAFTLDRIHQAYLLTGVRGVGSITRATGYGRRRDYASEANDSMCVLALVETRLGIENLGDIAATDGIDAVVIGASDLAADMGHLGQPYHPEVVGMVERGIAAALRAGKIAVSVSAAQEHTRRHGMLGCTVFIVGMDTALLANAVDQKAAEFAFLKKSGGAT